MKRFALSLALPVFALAGCGSTPAGMEMGAPADVSPAAIADSAQPADMAAAADLASSPDLAESPDLAIPPDLADPLDLAPYLDLTPPNDLTPYLDFSTPPDLTPLCNDNIKYGSESDVDCGGDVCPRCGSNSMCGGGAD